MSVSFLSGGWCEAADAARCLAGDLAALDRNGGPDPAVLAAAPLLEWWRPARRFAPALIGVVYAHPRIADGRASLTSEVYAIDPAAGWARTFSRFYRLRARLGYAILDRRVA